MRAPIVLPSRFSLLALTAGVVAVLLTGGAGEKKPAPHPGGRLVEARVLRVVDGDTAEARIDGRTEAVRYIGLDTPESVQPGTPVQCFGHEASEENARLVEGRKVRLGFGAERRDAYGRLLVYVHRGGMLVNARLLRGGFARTLPIAPNTDRASRFDAIQERAESEGRGLWKAC